MPRNVMHVVFYLLYHPFAFAYDLVAATVSFGHWNEWIRSVVPLLSGPRVLELGHGPGHLQRALLHTFPLLVGIDESRQMSRLARHRLRGVGRLARAVAQSLPFVDRSFDTIVSTFPSNYIFDTHTIAEIRRCLDEHGRLIVLPVAWPSNRLLQWLYRVTAETPSALSDALAARMRAPFENAGFVTEAQVFELRSSRLLVLTAILRTHATA